MRMAISFRAEPAAAAAKAWATGSGAVTSVVPIAGGVFPSSGEDAVSAK